MNVQKLHRASMPLATAIGLTLALGVAGCDTMGRDRMAGTDTTRSSASSEDASISSRVKARLNEDNAVGMEGVRVSTVDGTVTLSGFASSQADKVRAGQIARSVSGVRNVDNNLVVRLP